MRKKWSEWIGFLFLYLAGILVLFFLGVILFDIFSKGIRVVSWEFLTKAPQQGMTEGGIFPAILGTFLVSLITVFFAVPMGMFAAIFLHEYARAGKMTRLIRLAIRNLSGVPSIVYGLFGVVLFVQMMQFGTSVLSAGLTLTHLVLQQEMRIHPEVAPLVIILTDGAGNVSQSGLPAQEESYRMCEELCKLKVRTVVINMEHPAFDQGLAQKLADHLEAPCYSLKDLKAESLYRTVRDELDSGKA